MKLLLKILLVIILIFSSIGILILGEGYNMYKEALEETPLDEKVEEIKSKENYVKLSELPKTYLEAVV